jgi:M6 family metalloprotease-like protein
MRRTYVMRRLSLLGLSLALTLAACGDDAATTTTSTPPSSTTTTTSTTTPTTTGVSTTRTTVPEGLVDAWQCKVSDFAYTGVGVGYPRSFDRLQSTGDVQVAVLFTDFPDVAATRTPDEVFELILGTAEFFEAVSYGRLRIELIPHLEWLRMSEPALRYSWSIRDYDDHKAWIEEAAALADPDFDFTGIDEIVVLATPQAEAIEYGPTWTGGNFQNGSIVLDGTRIMNGATSGHDLLYWGFLWLPHEMGHSLSFVDLYDYDGGPGFTGEFSLMNDIAAAAPEYLAWERWHASWLDDHQVLCVTGDHTATLSPIEVAGGVKAAVVKTGPSRVVVVESRRAAGWDVALTDEGAIVYVVDTSIPSGYGPIEVLNGREALSVGESVTVDGVTVTVLDASDDGDTVEIVVDAS